MIFFAAESLDTITRNANVSTECEHSSFQAGDIEDALSEVRGILF